MVTYTCKLKTISPVHISAGSEYQYGSYEYIRTKVKYRGETISKIKRIDIPEYYKSLNHENQEELINLIEEKDYKLTFHPDAKNILKKYTLYTSINRSTKNIAEIQEHIKTNNKLYIPGSSIKGSLRTAILYDKINIMDITDSIFKTNKKNKTFIDNKKYNAIIDQYLSAKWGNKAQKNIMRFIQVSDTNTSKIPKIYDSISIQATPDYRYTEYKRSNRTVRTFIETINDITLKFKLKLNNNPKVLKETELNDKKDILDITYIKEALYNFSQDLIEYELEFIDTYNIDILTNFYEKLNKINTPDKPLIRIGAGSGLMATTLNMKIKEKNPHMFDKIRQASKGRNYPYEYPKSRKITCHKNEPLGWTQIEFNEE